MGAEPVDEFPEDLVFPGDEPGQLTPVVQKSNVSGKPFIAPETPLSVIPGIAGAGITTGPATTGPVAPPTNMTESTPVVPGMGASSPKQRMNRQQLLESVGGIFMGQQGSQPATYQGQVGSKSATQKQDPVSIKQDTVKQQEPRQHTRTKRGMDSDFMPGQVTKDLVILRPTYKLVDDLVAHATIALFDKATMAYDKQSGDAMIYHSRNALAHRFVESDFEWALWWDDDMIPPIGNPAWTKRHVPGVPENYPDNFLRINPIDRLKSHQKSIIGGLYYGRKPPHVPICERTDIEALRKAPSVQIVKRKWVGTGFLLTHRGVFLDIQKKFPELAPKMDAPNPWERVWNYFQPTEAQAEDVSFCARALEAGHQPYVDCSVVVAHLGTTTFGPWNQNKKR